MSNEELINELRDQADVLGAGTECHVLREAADAIETLDERVAIMSEGPAWIRPEDRLPAQVNEYMYEDMEGNEVVFTRSENVMLYLDTGDYVLGRRENDGWVDWYGCWLSDRVTHWMALPEAPGGEAA